MNHKTPKFNKAMEKYFSELKLDKQGGQERVCRVSGERFYVRPEDVEFYKKMQVPLPTLSPHERIRNQIAFFNFYNLYFNKSALTGKKIISFYPPQTKLPVWEHQLWHSDKFNPLSYGRDYDNQQSFFEQFKDFFFSVPKPNLIVKNCVNSDFGNNIQNAKNCYLTFDNRGSENSAYTIYIEESKEIYHSFGVVKSEIGYENNLVDNSYQVFFSENSDSCLHSSFLFDCKDCQNCFMSSNLRHKKYVFRNQQLSQEEYQQKIAEINFGSRRVVEELQTEYREMKKNAIHRAHHNEKNVNSTGDYNVMCKNCYSCFYTIASENVNYGIGGFDCRDVDSSVGGRNIEFSYNNFSFGSNNFYQVKFSLTGDDLRNCEYCDLCKNCSNCFACIGLKNKKFCIFNKQYSEEEYWKKLDEIKTKMLEDGEYGEFFPKELAPIPYNISAATSYGGYDDLEIAKKYGYRIEEVEEPNPDTKNEITIDEVPDDIKDVIDDILTKAIVDKKNNKKFKYTKEELEFHRKYNLALPSEHYSAILARKRIALGPIVFNPEYRNCAKCGEKTQVTFPVDHPDAPKEVYCEKCYNKTIG